MKKLGATLLIALMVLAGCASGTTTNKIGTASITSFTNTNATTEKAGSSQANTVFATVLLDTKGVIVDVQIDTAQNTAPVLADGRLGKIDATTGDFTKYDPTASTFTTLTKKEKGSKYGMAKASSIGKEWFDQIKALETYMIGKTVDQVSAIPVDAEGVTTDADLKSGATISITDYIAVVKKAAEGAVEVKGVTKVGSGSVTKISATAATADKAGKVEFDTYYTGIALDKDGKIVNVYNDVAQNTVSVSTTGTITITSKDPVNLLTKKELKDKYGMKSASGIGKEWYEQQAAFEAAAVGKTFADVSKTPVTGSDADEAGVPTGDLKSSVTISITDFINSMAKAVGNVRSVNVKK